jgi:uncharacterized protein YcfJ
MHPIPPLCLAALLALSASALFGAAPAQAQAVANTRIDYAQVLRVEPVYELTTVQAVDPDCLQARRPNASIGVGAAACKPRTIEVRKVVAYDVEYSYQGRTYMSRLRQDPGSKLRVRVSVTPDDSAAPEPVAPSLTR